MKNKSVWMVLVSLLFLGCTKTIVIREPVTYYEEAPVFEARPTYEIRTSSNEIPYVAEPVSVAQTRPFNIRPLEVFDKMQEPNILILDVRTVHEIPQDGKIANSVMIPLQVLAQNLNRIDKSKTIIVYCHVGNRSIEATKLLRSQGFDAINMIGGIEAWKRDHLSVRWK
jgi:rhodanese-related sulfurtransferase